MNFRFAAALAAAVLATVPLLAVAQSMNIADIINGIGGSRFLRDAERSDDASGLRVVRLSTLAGAEQSAGLLYDVMVLKERDIRYLWGNLVINPMAMTAIRNSGVTLHQIVSVHVNGDGGGVMYANDLF